MAKNLVEVTHNFWPTVKLYMTSNKKEFVNLLVSHGLRDNNDDIIWGEDEFCIQAGADKEDKVFNIFIGWPEECIKTASLVNVSVFSSKASKMCAADYVASLDEGAIGSLAELNDRWLVFMTRELFKFYEDETKRLKEKAKLAKAKPGPKPKAKTEETETVKVRKKPGPKPGSKRKAKAEATAEAGNLAAPNITTQIANDNPFIIDDSLMQPLPEQAPASAQTMEVAGIKFEEVPQEAVEAEALPVEGQPASIDFGL